jgi:hypothetical protein
MKINSTPLLVVAERHLRTHLKSKPQDDDKAALQAITGPMSQELGEKFARWVLLNPELPDRLKQVRASLAPQPETSKSEIV